MGDGVITARVEGLDKLQRGLADGRKAVATELRTAMSASLLLLEGDARRLAPRDTGRLQGSISSRISGVGANLQGEVGPSARYGFWVEFGRRPGRAPPIGAIAGWARRRGMSPYPLARAIARRGIKPRPYMQPAFERDLGKIRQLFDQAGATVVARLGGAA